MSAVVRFAPLRTLTVGNSAPASGWVPAADIVEDGYDTVITLAVPGVNPQDVAVEVRDHTLFISGARSEQVAEGASVVRREIRKGSFSRAFALPEHVTAESVSAEYTNGLLAVRVAGVRQPEPQPVRIPVNLGSVPVTGKVEAIDAASPEGADAA